MLNYLKFFGIIFLLSAGVGCGTPPEKKEPLVAKGPPIINSFSPVRQIVGRTVTIHGRNFYGSLQKNEVFFHGKRAIVARGSSDSLTVLVPSGTTNGTLSVTTPLGTAKSDDTFYVMGRLTPTISGFSPQKGIAGDILTITGENFSPVIENNRVFFNGTRAKITKAVNTSLTVIIPKATNGDITVSTLGKIAKTTRTFIFVEPDDGRTPSILGFTPLRGSVGDSVTITGLNFIPKMEENAVYINDTKATITFASKTSIVATIPNTTSGVIKVATRGGIAIFETRFEVFPPGGYPPIVGLMGGAIQSSASSLTGSVTTYAGGGIEGGSLDGVGVNARFLNPLGIDSDGTNIYIADSNGRKIRQMEISSLTVTSIAGSGNRGSTDGFGTNADFGTPNGVVEVNGALFVTDSSENKVRKVVITTGQVTTLAGSGTYGEIDATGEAAGFKSPYGITTDDGTNLYVVDSGGHKIRKIVIATRAVTTIAGSGDQAATDGIGAAASFNRPHGIICDGVNLYIADTNNHKIRKLVIATNEVSTFAGSGETGANDAVGLEATFHSPDRLAIDTNYIYVTDSENHKIRKIDIANKTVTTLAGAGIAGHKDQIGDRALFNGPKGIVLEGEKLYVTDSARVIRKIEISTKTVTTIAGRAIKTSVIDDVGTAAIFYYPLGITTDGTNLYIADSFYHIIRKIEISSANVTTFVGSGFFGDVDGTATSASFNYPSGITTDGVNLFLADAQNHKIRQVYIPTAEVSTLAGSGNAGFADGTGSLAGFNQPFGVTTDGTNVYVADTLNHRIRKIGISNGLVTTIAGTGARGSLDGSGDIATFDNPEGITTDGTNLYIADSGNNKIRGIVISTGVVTTIAGSGAYWWVNGVGTDAGFRYPRGITTDGTNLFVADSYGMTIRKIVISSGLVTTLSGSGDKGIADGVGTGATFQLPAGVTFNGTSLFVTDHFSHQIRKID